MRFVGMLPTGMGLVRLNPTGSWLDATPILVQTDPAPVREVTDAELAALAEEDQ